MNHHHDYQYIFSKHTSLVFVNNIHRKTYKNNNTFWPVCSRMAVWQLSVTTTSIAHRVAPCLASSRIYHLGRLSFPCSCLLHGPSNPQRPWLPSRNALCECCSVKSKWLSFTRTNHWTSPPLYPSVCFYFFLSENLWILNTNVPVAALPCILDLLFCILEFCININSFVFLKFNYNNEFEIYASDMRRKKLLHKRSVVPVVSLA